MAEHLADRGTRIVLITGAATGGADGTAARVAAAEIATDLRERCGVSDRRIVRVLIEGDHDREEVVQTVDREAGLAFGPLLIWYAGPASPDAAGRLCLGPGLAVPFADIGAILACHRVGWPTLVILDCAHSGQARLANPEWGLLTSAASGAARLPSARPEPGLTGHLLWLLSEGIPGGPPELSLELAYRYVAQAMAGGGQAPRLHCDKRIGALVLAPNPAANPRPGVATAGMADEVPRPRRRRLRLATALVLLSAELAVLAIAVVAVLLISRGSSTRSGPAALPTHSTGVTAQGPGPITFTDPGAVGQVAFSPDGKTLATVSEGLGNMPGTVRLWDLATGKNTVTIASPSMSIAWSPDSRTLVTGAGPASGSEIQLWNATTGTLAAQLSTLPGEQGQAIAISPDGRTLAAVLCGADSPCTILLLSLPSGTAQATLTTDLDQIPALAFSRDGTMLAAGGGDEDDNLYAGAPVSVWNLATDQLVVTLHGPVQFGAEPDQDVQADSVVYSPDDRTIAAASNAFSAAVEYTGVRLWNIATRTATTLTVTGGGALALSPDGRILATANADGASVQLWDTATRELITTIALPSTPTGALPFGPFSTLAFSPDGKTLATPDGNRVQLWSTSTLPPTTVPSPVAVPSATSPATSPAVTPAATPEAVVQEYYAAISDHDYRHAWQLGGDHSGIGSYQAFVAAFPGTSQDVFTVTSVSGDIVKGNLTAIQTNGTQLTFTGSYTVSGGQITSFAVRQTS